MSVVDLEYVERVTGISLDEDKPLSEVKRSKTRQSSSNKNNGAAAGAQVLPKKPEYDWFLFFLSCDVQPGLCERYAQAFNRDSMDESVLPDVNATILRTLGLKTGSEVIAFCSELVILAVELVLVALNFILTVDYGRIATPGQIGRAFSWNTWSLGPISTP